MIKQRLYAVYIYIYIYMQAFKMNLKILSMKLVLQLEIRSVKRGICPIATLYSLAAEYKGGRCKQGAIIFYELSFTGTELYRFEVPIGRNANF